MSLWEVYTPEQRKARTAATTKWKRSHRDKHKLLNEKSRLKRYFGITLEQRDTMTELQKNRCAICGNPPRTQRLAIDHDHATGRVRGLLCFPCNRFLIPRRHTLERLKKAVSYLERDFDGREL